VRRYLRREVIEETDRVLRGDTDEILIRVRRSKQGVVYSDSYEPAGDRK
jgi:hypothetical protein